MSAMRYPITSTLFILFALLLHPTQVIARPKLSRTCSTNAECLRQGAPLIRPRRLLRPSSLYRRQNIGARYDYVNNSAITVTLPAATYLIQADGARGGKGLRTEPSTGVQTVTDGGYGGQLTASVVFSTPTTLTLYVGQSPITPEGGLSGGGGGGTFVFLGDTLLMVAGGGGGGSEGAAGEMAPSQSLNGGRGSGGNPGRGLGGTGGQGGSGAVAQSTSGVRGAGAGGAGVFSPGGDGTDLVGNASSGKGGSTFPSFAGGIAPVEAVNGGFGGGGASGTGGGGGGGGYSGGGGGVYLSGNTGSGAGGGGSSGVFSPAALNFRSTNFESDNGYITIVQQIFEEG